MITKPQYIDLQGSSKSEGCSEDKRLSLPEGTRIDFMGGLSQEGIIEGSVR